MYKVIIDSNIWVSFLIGKSLRSLAQNIRNERITIITCKEQIQELTAAFQKPKLQKHFQAEQITTFFDFLKGVSHIVSITAIAPLCRDPKDDYLLALSIASEASYLVTGDADLLELKQINNTIIIKYADFDKIINKINNNSM
jgi:putative PIN family toxin of toxin-antitoxin system